VKAILLALSTLLLAGSPSGLDAQSSQPILSTDVVRDPNAKPPAIRFPQDLYDHPTYQAEWWYFTGNLNSRDNKQYGFELTFFRTNNPTGALAGQPQIQPIIFADLAVSDINGQHFYFHKSLAPEHTPQASITESPWSMQLGHWQLKQPSSVFGVFQLQAQQDNFGVDLSLQPQDPPVLHGDQGLFELDGSDGDGPEFFEYYSIPRLTASGLITVNGEAIPVDGVAWDDHEYFTLASGQTLPPWDWFSIQLQDGSSMMLYGLRLPNGQFDPASRGTFISQDGTVTHLKSGDFTLVPGRTTFHSTASNADYPIAWTINVPCLRIQLDMSTPLQDQELPAVQGGGSPAYWEGASRFRGTHDGKFVEGRGYVELTGYNNLSTQE
jgi:predicted secreted hydrolase